MRVCECACVMNKFQGVSLLCHNHEGGPVSFSTWRCHYSPVAILRNGLKPGPLVTLPHSFGCRGELRWKSPSVCWRRREGDCLVVSAGHRAFKRIWSEHRPSVSSIVQDLTSNGSNIIQVLAKQPVLKPSDWFAIMEGLGKQKKWLIVLEVFRWVQGQEWYRPDCGFYSKLIVIMGRAKQLRLARWLFAESKRIGHRPDTSLYNALITAHILSRDKGRGFEKAMRIFEDMKTKPKCKPNVVTYNILLRASAQAGDTEQVESFFQEMQAVKISPDIFSYNGVIDAYGKTENYPQMEKTLLFMREKNCKPDIVTYNTLIDAYGRGGAFSKMEQVLKSMMGAKSRHKPDLNTYNTIMCSYATAGDVENMERSLNRMEAALCKPNLFTYEVLIIGYGNVCAFDRMEECVNLMLETGLYPQVSTLRTMIGVYCNHKLFEEAEGLLGKARKWHIQPRTSLYLIILRAYAKENRAEDMERLLEIMRRASVLPNKATFMEFLDSFDLSNSSKELSDLDVEPQDVVEDHAIEVIETPSSYTLAFESHEDGLSAV